MVFTAAARPAASELPSAAIASHTLQEMTSVGPQIASHLTTPVTVSCSITEPSSTNEFQSPMSFTNTPFRPMPFMPLQSVTTQLPTAGTHSNSNLCGL
jgi:hypothetical protein